MKRLISTILAVILLLPALGAQAITPAHEAEIFFVFQDWLSCLDKRYALYEEAISGLQTYASKPDDHNLDQAKALCVKAIAEINALPLPEPSISEGALAALTDMGLAEDFYAPFDAESSYRYSVILSLQTAASLLESFTDKTQIIGSVADLNLRMLEYDRKIEYFCVNDFVNSFSADTVQSFRTDFLPTLTVFCKDGLPWGTDSKVLESLAEEAFAQYEAAFSQYQQVLGSLYIDVLEMQADTAKLMAEHGYTEDQIDAVFSK